jgi:hypothetical protein
MANPDYVNRGGIQCYAQPYSAKKARAYGFLIEVDQNAVQRNVCYKLFNIPSGGKLKYVPVLPYVMLTFTHIQHLASTLEPYASMGCYSESELAIAVLMWDEVSQSAAWTYPYIWVDNPLAMVMGREVFGIPKEIGWFYPPLNSQTDNDVFTVSTLVARKRYPPNEAYQQQIASVMRTDHLNSNPIANFAHTLKDMAGEALTAANLVATITKKLPFVIDMNNMDIDLPIAFLKEIRDVADGTKACYQSIIKAMLHVERIEDYRFLPGCYEAKLGQFDSHPICSDFGLPVDKAIPVLFGFCSMYDFTLGNGTNIWTAE